MVTPQRAYAAAPALAEGLCGQARIRIDCHRAPTHDHHGRCVGLAVEPTRCVSSPVAADWIGDAIGDAQRFERARVQQHRVNSPSCQYDRIVGRDGIERRAPVPWIGERRIGHARDPARAKLGGLRDAGIGGLRDAGKGLIHTWPGIGKTWRRDEPPRQRHVEVRGRLDQPRRHQAPADVDDAGRGAGQPPHLHIRSDSGEAPVLDRERFGIRVCGVRREDLGIDENEIGCGRARRSGGRRRGPASANRG